METDQEQNPPITLEIVGVVDQTPLEVVKVTIDHSLPNILRLVGVPIALNPSIKRKASQDVEGFQNKSKPPRLKSQGSDIEELRERFPKY